MKKRILNKQIIIIATALFFAGFFIILAKSIPVKSFRYQTSKICHPNMLPESANYNYRSFAILSGESQKYNRAVSDLKKLNIPQTSQVGCEYDTIWYELKLF